MYIQATEEPVFDTPVQEGLVLMVVVCSGSLVQAFGMTTTSCPLTGMGSAGTRVSVSGEKLLTLAWLALMEQAE